MRKYEVITSINPQLTEEELNQQVRDIETNLNAIGVKNLETVQWGKRELAFAMNKFNWAYFIKFSFDTDRADQLEELTGRLKIKDNLIKFQIHRCDQKERKFKGNPKKLTENKSVVDDSDSTVENW